mmetsp:Transcript_9555/g.14194  ORF Transcript_9555/g.14194 Transcript_9555/m.14194 type:complete len:86 (-) Transcript_9555:358-615(-)
MPTMALNTDSTTEHNAEIANVDVGSLYTEPWMDIAIGNSGPFGMAHSVQTLEVNQQRWPIRYRLSKWIGNDGTTAPSSGRGWTWR